MHGVVLQQVHEVLDIFAVVDGPDLEALLRVHDGLSEHEAANASETVDSDVD